MLTAALVLTVALSAQPAAPDSDEAGIRKVFEQYRSALLAKDGKAALAALDADTVAYYAKLREMALTADADTVKKSPLMDRISILRLRHEIGLAELQKMDGGALIVLAVGRGWVSAKSVEKLGLGKLEVAANEATGEALILGKAAPFKLGFKRNQGEWRFSLLPLMTAGEPALKMVASQSGRDENAFVVGLVEKVSGKPVPESVWEPLVPAAKPAEPKK